MNNPFKPEDVTRKIDLGIVQSRSGAAVRAFIEFDHNNRPTLCLAAKEDSEHQSFVFFHGIEETYTFLDFVSGLKEKIEFLRDGQPAVPQAATPQPMPTPQPMKANILKGLFRN